MIFGWKNATGKRWTYDVENVRGCKECRREKTLKLGREKRIEKDIEKLEQTEKLVLVVTQWKSRVLVVPNIYKKNHKKP